MAEEDASSQSALDGVGLGAVIALALGGGVQIRIACAAAFDLTASEKTELRKYFADPI
jgi:hypothetical protein